MLLCEHLNKGQTIGRGMKSLNFQEKLIGESMETEIPIAQIKAKA